jgi:polar amino acid transport system substrate-binding protein
MKSPFAAAALWVATMLVGSEPLAAASDLPEHMAAAGVLRVAVTPNYPPLEFRDPATNELTGFDIDLAKALARKLGVKLEWQESAFAQMIPALTTGRVDAIISGMTDLKARHDASTFVDYLRSGPQFFVQASRAGEFKDMQALCGKSVGTSRRTAFPAEIAAWSERHCGDNAIKVVGTEGSADARTQLKQGRVDAGVQGNETLPYVMSEEPNLYAPLGAAFAEQFTGIALAKDDTGLQTAIANALDALIADGSYKALLDKWQLSSDAIEKATINAGQ